MSDTEERDKESGMRFARSRYGPATASFENRRLEDLRFGRIKEVYEIWNGKRPDSDRLPPAEGFDILDYRVAMGRINLLSVHHDPLDFVFRVHCAQGVSYIGRDMTGRSVDAYPEPEYRDFVRSAFGEAVRTRQPQFIVEDMFVTENRLMRWEGMVLPMQDTESKVSALLVPFETFR